MGLIDKIRSYLNEEEPGSSPFSAEDDKAKKKFAASISSDLDEEPDTEQEREQDGRKKRSSGGFFSMFRKNKKEASKEPERKKRRSPAEINPELYNSIQGQGASKDERESAKEFCEQLIDVTYNMEDMKREYKLVTSYLIDIQKIEELPDDMANDLAENARRIDMLNEDKSKYIQSEKLLPMDRYNTMASFEKDVPSTIKKLIDMEMRDNLLKNDMSYLEGEKEDLKFMHQEHNDSISKIRSMTAVVLTIFLLIVGSMLIFSVTTKKSVTVYCLGVFLAAMIFFAVAYARYKLLKSEIAENDAKLNRAILLLNKVKVKFINNTNTLDYIYDKYGVNSSNELEYQWDQYNTMVRDALRYSQANNDLRVYSDELIGKLKNFGLEDPFVWTKQTKALIDPREMVEIKHGLNVRRQNIREKLATCEKIKTNATTALRAAIDTNQGLEVYINDLLSSYNIKLGEE
ncbi:MAG: hypothetical protein K2G45_07995 [Lachnospiraceae bacterium]|nr:hypothetical protein [Lachnospiraceae bacterium]